MAFSVTRPLRVAFVVELIKWAALVVVPVKAVRGGDALESF